MKHHFLISLGLVAAFFACYGSALALSTFLTVQGGTGTTTPSGILYGDNGSTTHLNTVVIGSNLTFSGGTLSAGSSFAYPFYPATNFGTTTFASSTPYWSPVGLYASSTSIFQNASTSLLTILGDGLGSLYTNAVGQVLTQATTSASTASQAVWRDANQNAFAQNFVSAATSFPTNGLTVTLTAASPRTWIFTGTNTQTMKLPSGTTLSNGASYYANNNSTLLVTVVDNGSNVLGYVPAGGAAAFEIYDNSTSNGSWDVHPYLGHSNVSGTNGLGLGTTSPYAQLSVFAGGDYLSHAASTLFAVGSSTAGTATTTFLSVLSNGNVGINTTAPTQALQVNGSVFSQGGNFIASSNNGLVWANNGSFKLSFDGSGNLIANPSTGSLAIGSSTPHGQLSVFVGGDYAAHAASTAFEVGSTTAGTATSTLFDVQSGGNVGVGTSSPAQPLSVNGKIYSGTGGYQFPDGTVQTTAATAGATPVAYSATSTNQDDFLNFTVPANNQIMVWGQCVHSNATGIQQYIKYRWSTDSATSTFDQYPGTVTLTTSSIWNVIPATTTNNASITVQVGQANTTCSYSSIMAETI